MSYSGDIALESTIRLFFHTFQADGKSVTFTVGTGAVFEDGGTTQITAGVTITTDFDGQVGLHLAEIAATASNGFEAGKEYYVWIDNATIDAITVIQIPVGHFSIENRSALRPTVAGRTLDVTAAGEAGLDLDNTSGTLAAAQLASDVITAAKIAADVTTEIVAGVLAGTIAELASPPVGNMTLSEIMAMVGMAMRNELIVNKTLGRMTIANEAGDVKLTKVVNDTGAIYTEGAMT